MTKWKSRYYLRKVRLNLEQCDDNSDKNEVLTQGCEIFAES